MGGKLCHPPCKFMGNRPTEKFYEISHLEIDLHILDLNPLGHDCIHKKKFGGLTIAKHPPPHNYVMSDDAIEYPLLSAIFRLVRKSAEDYEYES